jgi:cobalt-zinc-cadmium efflux system outer membrane protein
MHAALRNLTALLLAAAAVVGRPAEPSAAPSPPPTTLRLEDALRLLNERGLDLLIAEAATASADGDVAVASAIQNPALSLSYGRSFTYGHCTDSGGNPVSCGTLPDALLGAGLSDQGAVFDWLTGKRGLRIRAARSAAAAARASHDDVRRTLESMTKQAFAQAVIAKEALSIAREIAVSNARTADLTRERYEAGAISEADLARIEVAKLEADQAVDTAGQAFRDAKISLAFLLGYRERVPDLDVEGPELLKSRPPAALEGATADALLQRAREKRPDLVAATREREAAEASLSLARRERFPDVAVSLSYAQQGTNTSAVSPPTFIAGLSFPIPIFNQQHGEIQKAEASLKTQSLQAQKVEAQVVSDVETGLSSYTATSQLTRRMETSLLERARRARDLVSVQYEKGAASLIDYLDAQRTFIGTRSEYLQDLLQFWTAVFKLEQAVGEDLR